MVGEVNRGERFGDVECARFSVEARAVPVEDAVGRVAVLLDLHDEAAGADRVAAPARDEHRVARPHWHAVEQVGGVTVGERALEIRAGRAAPEARVERGIFRRIEQIPHFRLRFAAQLGGHVRGRVDLNGERVLRVEDFCEQGKAGRIRHVCAEDFRAKFCPQLVQRDARVRAACDDALLVLAIHEFPAFADGRTGGRAFAGHFCEAVAAPHALHEERAEGEGSLEVHEWRKTPNAQRPTPNFQSRAASVCASESVPWELDVGRWALGVACIQLTSPSPSSLRSSGRAWPC